MLDITACTCMHMQIDEATGKHRGNSCNEPTVVVSYENTNKLQVSTLFSCNQCCIVHLNSDCFKENFSRVFKNVS